MLNPQQTSNCFQMFRLIRHMNIRFIFHQVQRNLLIFPGLAKHSLTAQTYQRVNKGTMRVGLSADSCYDCNYLMFQNSGFGSKWFYAFITSVEYVNNAVTEITFEIDVMQTWFLIIQSVNVSSSVNILHLMK